VGLTNRLPGTAHDGVVDILGTRVPLLEGSAGRGMVTALVRPESVRLAPDPEGSARVIAVSFLGALCRVQVGLPDGSLAVAQVPASDARQLAPGTAVRVTVLAVPVFATDR
jgi:putative spermidine/putrescine transport system ATP-binding protein